MNKSRMQWQEMDLKGLEKVDDIWRTIKTIWINPFPNREERRAKERLRAGYSRRWRELKKIISISKKIKSKNWFLNKVRNFLNTRVF